MRRYFFAIRWPDRDDLDEQGTLLENDAAALDYACAMVRELRATGGKVRHEHVASFGSIELPLSVGARIEFWRGLHERLAKLSNRVDADVRRKCLPRFMRACRW